MKRREFLRRVAGAIALLEISDSVWSPLGDRYYQAMAAPTGRKLALLVGINQYPSTQPLGGCLTDVELQRELLIHRFGFNAADILTLSEQQATKQQIETAFLEHLIKQAQPGDVVVFHFSGYGRRVLRRAGGQGDKGTRGQGDKGTRGELPRSHYHAPTTTLPLPRSHYPITPSYPTHNSLVGVDNDDLLDETLSLLLRSLPTKNITTILDTSFHPPSTLLSNNLRVRAFPQAALGQISEAELAFGQEIGQLLCTGGLNRLGCAITDNLAKLAATPTSMPGIILVAADATGLATETKWNGFSAGLFTYALTQYLWKTTTAPTVQVSLSRVSGVVEQLVGTQPSGQENQEQFQLTYKLSPDSDIGADGVITAVEEDGKTAQLWLAGIPPTVLEYYETGSKLTVVASVDESGGAEGAEGAASRAGEMGGQGDKGTRGQGDKETIQSLYPLPFTLYPTSNPSPLQIQVRSRTGLTAKAQLVGEASSNFIQVGQLVQEAVRVLPRNIRLTIALATNLERIERVDATSAFAAIPDVSLVTTGEQLADYVFGRVPESKPSEAPTTLLSALPPSRYGLFSLGQKLIPNTAGEVGEAVKVAVQRLSPRLQTLLAAKLWRLTTNEGSSLLKVKATLLIVDTPEQVLMQRETWRTIALSPTSRTKSESTKAPKKASATQPQTIATLPIGSRIQYRVYNGSDRSVYLLLLGLDSSKNIIALYSTQAAAVANGSNSKPLLLDVAIAPGETIILPQTSVDFEWVIHKPDGLAEHQLIFSSARFTQTLAAMTSSLQNTADQQYIGSLSNPLEVAQAMMQDLHNASVMVSPPNIATSNITQTASSTTDTYSLDMNNWASLSFVYQVI